ncbi:unnamed protein product [Pleuronectes platessa]|uniref:Uncharacterized protein n=1 Tax=Pleuronectes platessa TaxID=8262 RepID=A0A9N7VKL4_PLEPL|nr:unnamed protein product [Pleuronectes platessa]
MAPSELRLNPEAGRISRLRLPQRDVRAAPRASDETPKVNHGWFPEELCANPASGSRSSSCIDREHGATLKLSAAFHSVCFPPGAALFPRRGQQRPEEPITSSGSQTTH